MRSRQIDAKNWEVGDLGIAKVANLEGQLRDMIRLNTRWFIPNYIHMWCIESFNIVIKLKNSEMHKHYDHSQDQSKVPIYHNNRTIKISFPKQYHNSKHLLMVYNRK